MIGRKRVVTEEMFFEIKKQKELGFTCRQIAQNIGLCFNTVASILRQNNLESYFECTKEISKRKRMKKKMAKGIAITEDVFNQIKAACQRGVQNQKIADVFGVSCSTVSTISTSKNFGNYKERVASYGNATPIVSVSRVNDISSYTKGSEIMDIIKKQDATNEPLLQQILWMTRTIGVTLGELYDLVLGENKKNENDRSMDRTNHMTEINVLTQNQQKQIELLERMIEQWGN